MAANGGKLKIWQGALILAAIIGAVWLFINTLNHLNENMDAREIAKLNLVCAEHKLGEAYFRHAVGVERQFYCKKPDGRLSRAKRPGDDTLPFLDGTEEAKQRWLAAGKEACAKAGLKNPIYLRGLGFHCEDESGALVPVFHPEETSLPTL
jgi:hypothetical protein